MRVLIAQACANIVDRMKHSVTELPFNRHIGLEAGGEGEELLRLPEGERYLNHLGTVHASALLALAEASSGELLLKHFGSAEGVVPVVRRLEAKFRKPAHGAVGAKAFIDAEELAQLQVNLASKGRAVLSVAVELYDSTGAHVMSATVEWFLAVRSEE